MDMKVLLEKWNRVLKERKEYETDEHIYDALDTLEDKIGESYDDVKMYYQGDFYTVYDLPGQTGTVGIGPSRMDWDPEQHDEMDKNVCDTGIYQVFFGDERVLVQAEPYECSEETAKRVQRNSDY